MGRWIGLGHILGGQSVVAPPWGVVLYGYETASTRKQSAPPFWKSLASGKRYHRLGDTASGA